MKVYYRYCDKEDNKPRFPGTDKLFCLDSFLAAFSGIRVELIADNCEHDLWAQYMNTSVEHTCLGNAGSFLHVLDEAVSLLDNLVYFSEDDYLYHPEAKKLLEEGLAEADYVTLYDHPDKYSKFYDGGEISKVFRTKSSHWRETISTCMTFGSSSKILKEDYKIWKKHLIDRNIPDDHGIFQELREKGRRLVVCIPGRAMHTDLTFFNLLGGVKSELLDTWAVEMMTEHLEKKLDDCEELVGERKGYQKLLLLSALDCLKNS